MFCMHCNLTMIFYCLPKKIKWESFARFEFENKRTCIQERIIYEKLYVYADFDWLKEVELIGELGYESLRGADSYSFTFNNEWLRQHSGLF